MSRPVRITAKINKISHTPKLSNPLKIYEWDDFINGRLSSTGSFILRTNEDKYAISQWVSPKRTRTFPFARIYDTLSRKNRVTIIPFCKDEGKDGDRDFIQWDTVSLMSLLNVYVVIGYYTEATKNMRPGQESKNKISGQSLDYTHIAGQIEELQGYHSSALHWNVNQMEAECLSKIAKLTLHSYRRISKNTGILLHNEDGIKKRMEMIRKSASQFKDTSRRLAQKAQNSESLTEQPKEKTVAKKAVVTMENYLGGAYYWTVDECVILHNHAFLIEKKHSKRKLLPSTNDIKDAFIKLALYSNLDELEVNGKRMPYYAMLGLTSEVVSGILHSGMSDEEICNFLMANDFNESDKITLRSTIAEAQCNGFGLFIVNSREAENGQDEILRMLINNSQ